MQYQYLFTLSSIIPLQAKIPFGKCRFMEDVFATATATTAYGIPDPVTNAKVVDIADSADCVIEFEHDENYDSTILEYKVSSQTNVQKK